MNNNYRKKQNNYKHHLGGIKPEEINETEQEAPLVYITPEEKEAAIIYDKNRQAMNELKKAEFKRKLIAQKRKNISIELLKLKNLIAGKNKLDEKNIAIGEKILKKLRIPKKKIDYNSLLAQADLNRIMDHAEKHGYITKTEARKLTKAEKKDVANYLNILTNKKKLRKFGRGGYAFYKIDF